MEGANGEEYFEYCVPEIILVERLDIANDNIGPRYLIQDELCLYESVGKKREERLSEPWIVAQPAKLDLPYGSTIT